MTRSRAQSVSMPLHVWYAAPFARQVCMFSKFEIGDNCVPFMKCWMTMRVEFEVATSGSATTNVAAFSANLLQTTYLPNREVFMELQVVLPSGWILVPDQTQITSQQGLLFEVVATIVSV